MRSFIKGRLKGKNPFKDIPFPPLTERGLKRMRLVNNFLLIEIDINA